MLSKRALCKIKMINNKTQRAYYSVCIMLFSLHYVTIYCVTFALHPLHCAALHCERTYKNLNLHGTRVGVALMCLRSTYVKQQKSKRQRSPQSSLHPRCITLHCITRALHSHHVLRYVGITSALCVALRLCCITSALHYVGIVFASH